MEQQELINALEAAGIDHKSGEFVDSDLPMFCCSGVVWKLFPELRNKTDNKGLIDVDDLRLYFDLNASGLLSMSAAGYFSSHDTPFAIMVHPYMRRGMNRSNNFIPWFLPLLLSPREKWDGCTIKLQLDADCVMLKKDVRVKIEREHWSGPYFTKDISNIKPGVAQYHQERGEYSNVTEYNWEDKKDGVFQLEIEEVRDDGGYILKEGVCGCKYLHSEYDRRSKRFVHFDGAVREYTKQQMDDRRCVLLNRAGSDQPYTKLFRIDGNIPFDRWKQLIGMYLIYNKTVEEYFGGKEK